MSKSKKSLTISTTVVKLPQTRVPLQFRKHILPPLMGIIVMVGIYGFFNSQLVFAKFNYRVSALEPAEVQKRNATTESTAIDPSMLPRIVINKIKVTAPIIFDLAESSETTFQKALQKGVVHYPETAKPGTSGNTVIFGHSSNQIWAPGDYKFVFALLEELTEGDKIFIEYQGIRYTYEVIGMKVVPPTDISVLQPSSKSKLTLITCTPVGTNEKRLIVEAILTSPKLNQDTDTSKTIKSPSITKHLPADAPSLFDSLKDLF